MLFIQNKLGPCDSVMKIKTNCWCRCVEVEVKGQPRLFVMNFVTVTVTDVTFVSTVPFVVVVGSIT